MSRKYFSLDRKAGRCPRHPALVVEDADLVSRPWTGFAWFHLSRCIFVSSDDAGRFLKLSKPCGCTVSTMGLSEARGLVLFQVIRGGIGVTQRLGATGTVSSTGHSHTHPRTRASQEPTDHHQKKITGDGRGSSPETLKRLAILVFLRRSFLPSSTVSALSLQSCGRASDVPSSA
jgi:hypothetical protein